MRRFFSRSLPPFHRVLLVESGSRDLYEDLLRGLYDVYPEMQADLVTCFAGVPEHLRAAHVYRVGEYQGRAQRKRLFRELAANNYDTLGIICSGVPIMTKWKWALAARLPAKVFVLNENGDYFWLDRGHLATIRHFILFRAGLTGSSAVETLARLVMFPFTLLYLILYALTVHVRRKLRTL